MGDEEKEDRQASHRWLRRVITQQDLSRMLGQIAPGSPVSFVGRVV